MAHSERAFETQAAPTWVGPEGQAVDPAQAEALVAPQLRVLFAYWTARKGGRMAPTRGEIAPRDIAMMLPWIHMHEAIEGGAQFRVRLVGSALVKAIGEQTGRVIGDGDEDLLARRMIFAMRRAIERKQPIRSLTPRVATQKPGLFAAENLWLPLSENGDAVDKILACTILTMPDDLL